jgi:hypothetical protein
VPHAATEGDPPERRAECEQDDQPEAVGEPNQAEPPEQDPAQPDRAAGQHGVDAGLELVRRDGPGDRNERHEGDRREGRERDVEPRAVLDDVVRTRPEIEPRAAVEEGVGKVEEVAPPRVEITPGIPVDDGRDDGDGNAEDGASARPEGHAAPATAIRSSLRGRLRRRDVPTANTATSAAQKAMG